jgi:hypothetical protein
MIHLPNGLYIQAQVKMAECEAEAGRERLLREVSGPSKLRIRLASLFQQLAAGFTLEPAKPPLTRSRQY